MESNKMIAEFMGWKESDGNDGVYHKGQWYNDKYEHINKVELLPYNTSWDWLKPVIDKISEIGLDNEDILISDWYRNVTKYSITVRIDYVHKSVVEFIEWYNFQRGGVVLNTNTLTDHDQESKPSPR